MTRISGIKIVSLWAIAASAGCTDVAEEGALPGEVVWRGEAYDRLDQVGEDGVARLPEASKQPSAQAALGAQSREELAESLRMAILHPNGGAYVARSPNWAAADAVLNPSGPIDRVSRASAERAVEAARRAAEAGGVQLDLGSASPGTAEMVIGTDGRALSPTSLDPYRAIAKVDVYTSALGGSFRTSCTGAYIGPWTFVLAGHCLRFTDGTFARRIVFQPARSGGSLPYGQFDCRNGDAATNNDFLAAVPAGYAGVEDDSRNFAVIDTWPCHGAPNAFLGYTVDSGQTTYSAHGYPIGLCPGAPAEGTYMCGMSGEGYVNGWMLESAVIDATEGQDGMPWWTTNATRVAGVHVGYRQYHDFWRCGFDVCRRNYARRIDGAMDTFIRSIAFDF